MLLAGDELVALCAFLLPPFFAVFFWIRAPDVDELREPVLTSLFLEVPVFLPDLLEGMIDVLLMMLDDYLRSCLL
jgi:hypothetical protein